MVVHRHALEPQPQRLVGVAGVEGMFEALQRPATHTHQQALGQASYQLGSSSRKPAYVRSIAHQQEPWRAAAGQWRWWCQPSPNVGGASQEFEGRIAALIGAWIGS